MGNLDYTQVLNKIENTRRFGNEPGVVVTAQVIKVLREKGKQKRIIPYIHVAGTNGKGSVCAFFSSILKKEHMRVGTFVSPHLVDFEERITVDGRMIAKEDVTRLGNYLLDIDFGIGLTMFDYCLAMALLYFEEQQCDYMVIETGLGGRLDSTNAIGTPQCAVITKIGYDHMAILGSDIADIAAEKAGIIKENSTVVVEQQDKRAMQVIEQEAQKKHARIITVEQSDIARCSGYALRLCGTFQWENAAAAELAARYVLGKHYGGPEYEIQYDKTGPKSEKTNLNDRIKSALEEAVWPGRMEIVSKEPFLLVESGAYGEVEEAFAAAGITPNIRLRVHDDYSLLSMVEQGMGVSVLTELVLHKTNYDVVSLPIQPPIIRTLAVVTKDRRTLPLAARVFIDELMAQRETLL